MNQKERIDPLAIFGNELCSVQNPAIYVGGELGEIKKSVNEDLFDFAIAFPDVYQIGMSNQAVKIIYNALNAIKTVRCERVFAVEKDFENLLKKYDVPLYTLETGIPLKNLDMIGFSIGYELGITGVLSILDLGRIPLLKEERNENNPIVLAGGCGATNMEPFADFFDAAFIGEAEGGMFDLIEQLSKMKKNGSSRAQLLEYLSQNPHVWMSGKKASRAIWKDFGKKESVRSFLPLPLIKPVQDHGVVEIMRGCPNGCRFCHAGIYYRPQRVKEKRLIFKEVERLVGEGGYRSISLTSLSSADYPEIESLMDELNAKYKVQNVSFQLPSLKVNSFSLPLLEKISAVRKSSLTFAVETPDESWQLMLNKEVYAQHLVEIILDAKKRGWNRAKFYFMIGLPFPEIDGKTEEGAIVDFMTTLQAQTKIQCSVNVGVFIPKPHTPYQWAKQITPEEADKKLNFIRKNLPKGKFLVGGSDTFSGVLEGLLSRGDRRAGKVILSAYKNGARLDAWENNLRENREAWEKAFDSADFDVQKQIFREREKDEALPWDSISLGPAKSFYLAEWNAHEKMVLTKKCEMNCTHRCGVCKGDIASNTDTKSVFFDSANSEIAEKSKNENIPILYRAIFSFSEHCGGEFLPHLSLIEIFNRALIKSSFPILYSSGFNPLPKLEFATTLSLGIRSFEEIASVIFLEPVSEEDFKAILNKNLPSSIRIERCMIFPVSNKRRRESLASLLWGGEFCYDFLVEKNKIADFFDSAPCSAFCKADSDEFFLSDLKTKGALIARISFKNDRPFRNLLCEYFALPIWQIAKIVKKRTFAKSFSGFPIDYFDLYKQIAEINDNLIKEK